MEKENVREQQYKLFIDLTLILFAYSSLKQLLRCLVFCKLVLVMNRLDVVHLSSSDSWWVSSAGKHEIFSVKRPVLKAENLRL